MIFIDVEEVHGCGDGPRKVELCLRVEFSQAGSVDKAGTNIINNLS